MRTIQPPWTPEQVDALNKWQTAGHVPSFTCGVCRDRDTDAKVAEIEAAKAAGQPEPPWRSGPEHALVATADGWVCETCDYTQDWAHEQMLRLPRNIFDVIAERNGERPAVAVVGTGGAAAVRLAMENADPDSPWMQPIDAADHLDHASQVMADLADLAGDNDD